MRTSLWSPMILVQSQRGQVQRQLFLIANGGFEHETFQKRLGCVLLDPVAGFQHQFTHFHSGGADSLAIAAIQAVIHVPGEFVGGSQSSIDHRLDHGHPTSG